MKITAWVIDRRDPDAASMSHEEQCARFELDGSSLKFYRTGLDTVPYLVTRNWNYFTVEQEETAF